MSLKGNTNRKWNSTGKYRDAFDRIFGQNPEPEGTVVCGNYEILTSMCLEYNNYCDLRCLNEMEFDYENK